MTTTEGIVEIPRLIVDKAQVPDHIREDIGNTLFQRFMKNISDPEKLQLYNELGRAFMERQAEKAAKGGQT